MTVPPMVPSAGRCAVVAAAAALLCLLSLPRTSALSSSTAAAGFKSSVAELPSKSSSRSLQGDGDLDRCALHCLNGGKCKVSSDIDVDEFQSPPYYCECPPGYAGITCEEKTKECGVLRDDDTGRTKRYCQHGAPCLTTVDADGKRHHTCQCERAFGTSAYAGEQCEHPATAYCEGGNVQRTTFCTNGGACIWRNETNASNPHTGCDCPPDFEGQFCEYLKGTMPSVDTGEPAGAASDVATKLLGGFILALVAAVVLCVLYTAFKNYKQRRAERRMLAAAVDSTAELALDPRGSFIFDDTESEAEDLDDGAPSGGKGGSGRRETELTRKGGKLYSGAAAIDENEII